MIYAPEDIKAFIQADLCCHLSDKSRSITEYYVEVCTRYAVPYEQAQKLVAQAILEMPKSR